MRKSNDHTGRLLAALIAAAIGALQPASGEQEKAVEPPAPQRMNLKEEVHVILRRVDFLALDRKHRPITDLRQEEVRLWDEGEEQRIASLLPAHETPACCQKTTGPMQAAAGGGERPGPTPSGEPPPGGGRPLQPDRAKHRRPR